MSTIGLTQEEMLSLIDAAFVQPVVEQGIPDINTVRRNTTTGKIEPYIAVQFGGLQQQGARSFVGPRGDDYVMPFYAQCIAPEAKTARQLQNKLMDVLLGAGFPWSGNVRQRSGGPLFPMTNSNSATEAYTAPSSFGLLVQFE